MRRSRYQQFSPEEGLQATVFRLLDWSARPGVIYYHSPNGLPSSPISVARFLKLGMRPGVADISLVLPGARAAFIELKTETGTQSQKQREFQLACEINGAPYTIARSFEEAKAILESLGALREARAEQRRAAA